MTFSPARVWPLFRLIVCRIGAVAWRGRGRRRQGASPRQRIGALQPRSAPHDRRLGVAHSSATCWSVSIQRTRTAQPIFGAAESAETSEDGLTWTFKIRPHTWSDGVPVSAEDFVFAYRRILDPKTAAQYANVLYPIKNAQKVNKGDAAGRSIGCARRRLHDACHRTRTSGALSAAAFDASHGDPAAAARWCRRWATIGRSPAGWCRTGRMCSPNGGRTITSNS